MSYPIPARWKRATGVSPTHVVAPSGTAYFIVYPLDSMSLAYISVPGAFEPNSSMEVTKEYWEKLGLIPVVENKPTNGPVEIFTTFGELSKAIAEVAETCSKDEQDKKVSIRISLVPKSDVDTCASPLSAAPLKEATK